MSHEFKRGSGWRTNSPAELFLYFMEHIPLAAKKTVQAWQHYSLQGRNLDL